MARQKKQTEETKIIEEIAKDTPTVVAKEDDIEQKQEDIAPKMISPQPKVKPAKSVEQPDAVKMPSIIGGVCEFCGEPYNQCKHYKGIDIFCSYCLRKDMIPWRRLRIFNINGELLVLCDDYTCEDKHNKKYNPTI
jgi:formylmethanofuran dehydrogenase subunit E